MKQLHNAVIKMKSKILPLLLLAQLVFAHEEENPPLLQGFVHWLGISEEAFAIGGAIIFLALYLLWKKLD